MGRGNAQARSGGDAAVDDVDDKDDHDTGDDERINTAVKVRVVILRWCLRSRSSRGMGASPMQSRRPAACGADRRAAGAASCMGEAPMPRLFRHLLMLHHPH
jgi:hypothetical protein